MAVLPAEIPTGLVTGQFYFVSEDAADANTDPELEVVSGFVRFTSSAKVLRMPTKKATIVPLTFNAKFNVNGELVSEGDPSIGLKLPATDSDLINPKDYTWRADFFLRRVSDGHTVQIDPFSFKVPAGGTVDLTTVMPVQVSNGVQIIQGPPGPNTVPTDRAVDEGISRANIPRLVRPVVEAEIQPLLEPTVKQIAAAYVASNPAVVDAAAAAVDAHPRIQAVDQRLAALTRVDSPVDSGNGLSFAVTSPSGQVSELALDESGSFADWVLERWSERMAVTKKRVRRTAVALTHASGANQKDARTAVHVRLPLKLGVAATIKAIHIRNYEDRAGQVYPGALAFQGIYLGRSAKDSAGQMNGQFVGAPEKLAAAFTTPADGGECVVDGLNIQLSAGTDYLLSYGYTCAAQENHKGVGGCWTDTAPANAGNVTDAGLVKEKFAPLDVWLEVETSAPIVAYAGDSLSCGVSAELPGYQSVPMIHSRANGYLPLMYTHSGSAMTSWTNPNVRKYTKWAGLDKPDALVFSLAKNDMPTATSVDELRARFQAVYPVITAATSSNMFLTTCLPDRDETTERGVLERAWNEVLLTEQLGNAVNVFDTRKAITKPGGGLDPVHDSGDGVHLTKRGYAAVAAAITHPLHG